MKVVINIALVSIILLLFLGSVYVMPILLGSLVFAVLLYFLSRIKFIKVVSINLLILFVSLFLVESFLISSDWLKKLEQKNNKQVFTVIDRDTKKEINESKSYIKTLFEHLGAGPMPNTIINSQKIRKGKEIYNVDYTIDRYGHRITGSHKDYDASIESILFFGCSFTYGEGVEDEQSLPYIFNQLTSNQYNIYNFGFSNYGAHQMLTILENDIEKASMLNNQVGHVFYQGILDHINRSAFATHPKYILDDQNKLHSFFLEIKDKDLSKSNSKSNNLLLLKLAASNKRNRAELDDGDRDLFLQIVKKSRDLVKQKYGSKFTVILWDLIKDNNLLTPENEYNLRYVTQGLKELNIEYVLISDIFTDYKKDSKKYTIKGDGHPSYLAHKKIAEYINSAIFN